MYPEQQTSVGLTFVGLPEAKEGSTLFMFDLAASVEHHSLSAGYGNND